MNSIKPTSILGAVFLYLFGHLFFVKVCVSKDKTKTSRDLKKYNKAKFSVCGTKGAG